MNDQDKIANFELSQLLHPAQAFAHPSDVVNDPDLTLNEKRAILASWASDACAIEAAPALRKTPGGAPVSFDDVMEALRALDREAQDKRPRHWQRVIRRGRVFGRDQGGQTEQGPPIH